MTLAQSGGRPAPRRLRVTFDVTGWSEREISSLLAAVDSDARARAGLREPSPLVSHQLIDLPAPTTTEDR